MKRKVDIVNIEKKVNFIDRLNRNKIPQGTINEFNILNRERGKFADEEHGQERIKRDTTR